MPHTTLPWTANNFDIQIVNTCRVTTHNTTMVGQVTQFIVAGYKLLKNYVNSYTLLDNFYVE